jgi:hypothetical protein
VVDQNLENEVVDQKLENQNVKKNIESLRCSNFRRSDPLPIFQFHHVDLACRTFISNFKVVFTKNPAAMTWQYPQPRTLTRVSIFPVPFKSASESGIDFGDDKEVKS